MKAIILNVGDEVLSGRVINSNASLLASKLETIGIITTKQVVIGDNKEDIRTEVENFLNSDCEVLVTTGGLGPTHDDFTKEEIAKTLNLELVFFEEAKLALDNYFKKPYSKCNFKQTLFPKGSLLIPNELGTADGCIIEYNGKTIIILVGPPYEMQPMVEETVIPYLNTKSKRQYLIKEYTIMGVGESDIEETIIAIQKRNNKVNIAPYCSIGKIRFQITADIANEESFLKAIQDFERTVDQYIISSENEMIEEVLVKELIKRNWTISFAESCTGGLLASTIINVNGASNVINESLVTYSPQAKNKYLSVSLETISKYNVVSDEVVLEMVQGLKKLSHSNINVSVSGIAGPSGGSKDRPVGLVHYAINVNDKTYVEHKVFNGNRDLVRKRAVMWILYRTFVLAFK